MEASPKYRYTEGGILEEIPACLAVLGNPVHHSISPVMHNAALNELSNKAPKYKDWAYTGIEVKVEDLPSLLKELWSRSFVGINLTIPHKVAAIDLINEIDEEAKMVGAVNTLKRNGNSWKGYNTDGYGILNAIRDDLGINIHSRDVFLYGAGGASRAIAVACLQAGCSRLTIINRTAQRLEILKEQITSIPMFEGYPIRTYLSSEEPADFQSGGVVINATSLGLNEEDPAPFSIKQFNGKDVFVYDTTYGCMNQLSKDCHQNDVAYANGLSMLVWQGAKSLEIWTGKEISSNTMKLAAMKELKSREVKVIE